MTKQIDHSKTQPFGDSGGIPVKTVQLDEVLMICTRLGKELQGIPTDHRKLAVSRLRNKSNKLLEEGDALGAVMLGVVAESWNDFGQ